MNDAISAAGGWNEALPNATITLCTLPDFLSGAAQKAKVDVLMV
jgi:hypothetical protein